MNSNELRESTRVLAAEERRITAELLEKLREIERRRLYAEWGYSSLFAYVTRELKYSEASAMRRINAMRFVRGLPVESRQAIEEGQVNLSTLSLAQTRAQAATPQEKLEIFETLKGKSQKQTEQLLADRVGEPIPEERERVLAGGAVQIQFVADAELAEMLERIRRLTAHVNPQMSYAELIKTMAKRTLKQLDPAQPRMTRSFSAAEKRCSTNQPTSRAIPRTIPQTTRRMV